MRTWQFLIYHPNLSGCHFNDIEKILKRFVNCFCKGYAKKKTDQIKQKDKITDTERKKRKLRSMWKLLIIFISISLVILFQILLLRSIPKIKMLKWTDFRIPKWPDWNVSVRKSCNLGLIFYHAFHSIFRCSG